jgi:hypothetical protein
MSVVGMELAKPMQRQIATTRSFILQANQA